MSAEPAANRTPSEPSDTDRVQMNNRTTYLMKKRIYGALQHLDDPEAPRSVQQFYDEAAERHLAYLAEKFNAGRALPVAKHALGAGRRTFD